MKRICLLAAALLLLFPQPARPAALYWGLGLLAADFQQKNLSVELRNVTYYLPQKLRLADKADSSAYGAAFVFGLDFNQAGDIPLRLELESTLTQGGSIGAHGQYRVPGPMLVIQVDAEVDVETIFSENLNLWLEPPKGLLPFRPYIGASIGLNYMPCNAELIFNKGTSPGYTNRKSQTLSSLQYGLGGGAAFQVGQRTFLDLSLRYLKSDVPHNINFAPAKLKFASESLNLILGFRYYF